jgi:hypothetical protein
MHISSYSILFGFLNMHIGIPGSEARFRKKIIIPSKQNTESTVYKVQEDDQILQRGLVLHVAVLQDHVAGRSEFTSRDSHTAERLSDRKEAVMGSFKQIRFKSFVCEMLKAEAGCVDTQL